jgi:hypothetical protein
MPAPLPAASMTRKTSGMASTSATPTVAAVSSRGGAGRPARRPSLLPGGAWRAAAARG